ncbi:hypothetical protein [Enterocloster hominis (ex Hitch et al. 2024)]|uniref:HNH endonuclease n=1 Tax=Enterocloster hominis (ex Hitch et al. 2024) TaxID=1917870 RepID=A0ABV1D1X1_9FIRM
MGKFIDLTGQKFGMWTVLYYVGDSKWQCRCDCGTIREVKGVTLRNQSSTNCGCVKRKHGMEGTKLYRLWSHMKERCDSPKFKSYKDYGGRGITYCEEWKEFKAFMEWALQNGYQEEMTLDRINVNGNYEPSNCRFISNLEQQRNKRNSRLVTINGDTKAVSEWAEISGLDRHTILYRLNNGMQGMDLLKPGRKGGGLVNAD